VGDVDLHRAEGGDEEGASMTRPVLPIRESKRLPKTDVPTVFVSHKQRVSGMANLTNKLKISFGRIEAVRRGAFTDGL
jgi:hypothetical protein